MTYRVPSGMASCGINSYIVIALILRFFLKKRIRQDTAERLRKVRRQRKKLFWVLIVMRDGVAGM